MNYLSKTEILGAKDAQCEDVAVPEWGGVVRVKSLSGREKDVFEASLTITQRKGDKLVQTPNMANVRAKLVAASVVDENNVPVFTSEDIAELGNKSAAALDRIVDVAKRLSRFSAADLKELEAGLKNDQPAALPTA